MKQIVSDAVVFECELPEPRDKVWRALTERELLSAWLLPNDIRPQVGAKFQLGPATDCEILAADPGRTLSWRQREPDPAGAPRHLVESVVSFELADLPGGGTHLRVVHDRFRTIACSAIVLRMPTKAVSLGAQPVSLRTQAVCLRRAA